MRLNYWLAMGTILAVLTLGPIERYLSEAVAETSEDIQSLVEEIHTLQDGQQAIREELQAIKKILTTKRQVLSSVQDVSLAFNVSKDPSKGSSAAPLTLIEFTDYQCPYCARHIQRVLPQIEKQFIDTGKVRYVLRDFPLASMHPLAGKAHEAAHCAGQQGKYWEMHDLLFANQKSLQGEKLAGYAKTVGVPDGTAFQACLDDDTFSEQGKRSVAEGSKAGVRGTPSFLLGRTAADGTVNVVKLIRGAQPFKVFQQQIEALLTEKQAVAPPTTGKDK